MMSERPATESTEVVISAATTLLGAVLGVALAFGLWTQLHRSTQSSLLSPAVAALGIGLSLTGLALPRFSTRLFLLGLGVSLVAAFFLAGPLFQSIAP